MSQNTNLSLSPELESDGNIRVKYSSMEYNKGTIKMRQASTPNHMEWCKSGQYFLSNDDYYMGSY